MCHDTCTTVFTPLLHVYVCTPYSQLCIEHGICSGGSMHSLIRSLWPHAAVFEHGYTVQWCKKVVISGHRRPGNISDYVLLVDTYT